MSRETEHPVYPGDWAEDFLSFKFENGYYQNVCMDCKHTFMGHKRRTICKICAQPDWERIAGIERPNNLPAMFRGAWSEGEMVGYSRCMVKQVKPLTAERDYYKELSQKQEIFIEMLSPKYDPEIWLLHYKMWTKDISDHKKLQP